MRFQQELSVTANPSTCARGLGGPSRVCTTPAAQSLLPCFLTSICHKRAGERAGQAGQVPRPAEPPQLGRVAEQQRGLHGSAGGAGAATQGPLEPVQRAAEVLLEAKCALFLHDICVALPARSINCGRYLLSPTFWMVCNVRGSSPADMSKLFFCSLPTLHACFRLQATTISSRS